MIFLVTYLDTTLKLLKSKRSFVLILLLVFVSLYAVLGGFVFHLFEHEAHQKEIDGRVESIVACISRNRVKRAKLIYELCIDENMPKEKWTLSEGIIFAVGSITTIGYGGLTLVTISGRLFYIGYCVIGMPLGLVLLGNLGKFMEEGVALAVKKVKKCCLNCRKKKKHKTSKVDVEQAAKQNDDEEEEQESSNLWLLILFVIYITIGVVALIVLKSHHWSLSLLSNFNSFTAIDASAIFTTTSFWMPVTIVYVIGGLALATIAIGVLGKYLRKLHYLGQKLKNSGKTTIHFGGKDLTVKDFARAVGEKWGVSEDDIDNIDLDKVVTDKLDDKPIEKPKKKETKSKPQPKRTRAETFEQNRREALRKHSGGGTSRVKGRGRIKMDPKKLHEAYQKEWERKQRKIAQRRGETLPQAIGSGSEDEGSEQSEQEEKMEEREVEEEKHEETKEEKQEEKDEENEQEKENPEEDEAGPSN